VSVRSVATGGVIDGGDVTIDAFFGGRVEAVQPAAGHHRAGLEAVLLAASVPAEMKGTVIDLGAGAGVAGLCIAARCPDATVVLVERDATLTECARAALARPENRRFVARIEVVETDIANRAGLSDGMSAAVVCNPPFYPARAASMSPAPSRADAHVLGETGLDPWFRAAAALVRPGGTATAIFRADGLDLVIEAASNRFGALDILPIAPRPGMAAHRILVRGIKASRAPLRLLPPLVLHDDDGSGFRPEVEAILREGAELSSVVPSWKSERSRTS